MVAAKPDLLIPIEVKARELPAKMAFACLAASRGHRVLIGRGGAMLRLTQYVRGGIYLEKNITPPRLPHLQRLRELGHHVLAWDEESVALISYPWYLTKNIHADTLSQVDAFLTLGEAEREAIATRFPGISDIRPTGNLRFDLLRPELRGLVEREGDRYRAELGPYVIVNSNFSRANGYVADIELYIEGARRMFRYSDASVDFLRRWIAYSAVLYGHFRNLVPVLSKGLADHTIVVRPHPSERADTWQALAGQLPNVVVRTDGTAVGWMSRADAIVHNGCTTGVEAFALGRLPIAFQPEQSVDYDIPLPNELSIHARSPDEVVDLCRLAAERGRTADEVGGAYRQRRDRARRFITGLDGPTASELILQAASAHAPADRTGRDRLRAFAAAEGLKLNLNFARARAKELARDALIAMSGAPARPPVRSKFGSLGVDEILNLHAEIAAVAPERAGVSIRPIGLNCFMLEAK